VADSVIDLRSDTLSLPTEEMLRSILTARLGDDSREGDPTARELEALAAEMLGKEAGLLTVSGTASNILAMRTLAEPGGAAIVEESAHLYGAELGGVTAACGLLVLTVPGHLGAMDPDQLKFVIRKAEMGFPAPGLVCLENTHNAAGGTVISPEHTDLCCEIARSNGLPVHLDGARIFNAAVALEIDVRELARSADMVSFCLSKGLSAPIGSLLLGKKESIGRARKIRRALGGTLRQAGIIAAPGIVALRKMIDRLEEDHAHARVLATGLASIEGLRIDMDSVQTDIVNVDVKGLGIDGATFSQHLLDMGVRGLPGIDTTVRFVTYRNIHRRDIEKAVDIVRRMVAKQPWN